MLRGVTSREQLHAGKSTSGGKGYILAIGIDAYQHCPMLRNAVRDVHNFTSVLTHRYQFDAANLTLLTNEQATYSNIIAKFRLLQEKVTPEDTVIIYFSGHGTFEKEVNEGYWIPVEGDVEHPNTLIPNSTIVKRVEAIKSKHTLLIADSCFAGSFFFTTKIAGIKERLSEVPSRWAFTSGRNKVVADDSPFALGLTGYLNYNTQNNLWLTELSPKIIEQVGANSEQIPQCEPLRNVGHEGGEFLFRLKENAPPPLPFDGSTLAVPYHSPGPVVNNRLWWFVGAVFLLAIGGLGIWQLVKPDSVNRKTTVVSKASLAARKSAIDLGAITAGTAKTFELEVFNSGAITAEGIQIQHPEPIFLDETVPLQIQSGKTESLHFTLKTKGVSPGNYQKDLVISGSNLEQTLRIPVTFSIKSEGMEHSEPLQAKLQANETVIDLSNLTTGTNKTFEVTLRNTGTATARGIQISQQQAISLTSPAPEQIRAGSKKTLQFTLDTRNMQAGEHQSGIRIIGENVEQTLNIKVRFTLFPPAPERKNDVVVPPPRPTLTVNCNIGRPNCSFRFYDTTLNKQVEGKSNATGDVTFVIDPALRESTVKVNYSEPGEPVRSDLYRYVKIGKDGCFELP